jgi:alpha-methylacyl-CoA racemase
MWNDIAGTNLLDSGAPFYDVYETSDGRHVAVGALESQFHARLLTLLGIAPEEMVQWDRDRWPEHRRRLAEIFRTRTRDDWAAVFDGEDACVSAVLGLTEGPDHPQVRARQGFTKVGGRLRPSPAPRFDRTPAQARGDAPDAEALLRDWGVPT